MPLTVHLAATLRPWTACPSPATFNGGFFKAPGWCFRMIYSDQLQATHCYERPEWKGVWKDRLGKSHYVEACREHAPKVKTRSAL